MFPVHEDWLWYRLDHFEPIPAELSATESQTITGFAWWDIVDLETTTQTVYPPRLGLLTRALLMSGPPVSPTDIGERVPMGG